MTTPMVGNRAGWRLELFVGEGASQEVFFQCGADDYNVTIEASLPGDLAGGAYSIAIEGFTSEDHGKVSAQWGSKPVYARLYLFWSDTDPVTDLLSDVIGLGGALGSSVLQHADKPFLVAELLVTRLSQRMGARRYETLLEGCERVYALLDRPLPEKVKADSCLELAVEVAKQLDVEVVEHPAESAEAPPAGVVWTADGGTHGLKVIRERAQALERLDGRFGRGAALIRDGKLHLGTGRPMPLSGELKALGFENGLVQVEPTGFTASASQEGLRPGAAASSSPRRGTYQLLLKGRSDLKPGEVVSVRVPSSGRPRSAGFNLGQLLLGQDVASPGDGEEVRIYLSGVTHRLSRTAGFITTATGVDLQGEGQEWDEPPTHASLMPPQDPADSPEGKVLGALHKLVQSRHPEPLTVAEVREVTPSGSEEPPGQTVSVQRGLVPADGLPRQARRQHVDREVKAVLPGVPYLTPFAWGKCGLVLPRYPGTRVLVGHHQGREDDPVDLGSLWESGRGPDAEPGDWWLSLPAEVPAEQRRALQPGAAPQEPTGKVTNDLTDADGVRVIEVGKLTVRIGTDKLKAAGARPTAADEPVTIEHEKGSRIVIKQNGDIEIHSEGALTLAAKTTLTLEADDVNVKVKNAMDVGDR